MRIYFVCTLPNGSNGCVFVWERKRERERVVQRLQMQITQKGLRISFRTMRSRERACTAHRKHANKSESERKETHERHPYVFRYRGITSFRKYNFKVIEYCGKILYSSSCTINMLLFLTDRQSECSLSSCRRGSGWHLKYIHKRTYNAHTHTQTSEPRSASGSCYRFEQFNFWHFDA